MGKIVKVLAWACRCCQMWC